MAATVADFLLLERRADRRWQAGAFFPAPLNLPKEAR